MRRKPFNGGWRAFIDGVIAGTIKAERVFRLPEGGLEYDDPEEPDLVAIGGVYISLNGTDPGLPTTSGG